MEGLGTPKAQIRPRRRKQDSGLVCGGSRLTETVFHADP